MSNPSFTVGDRIRLIARPPYLKSAETMPMLRPPDLVDIGEEGTILSRKPGGYLGVRFSRGAFLVDAQYIEAVEGTDSDSKNGANTHVKE